MEYQGLRINLDRDSLFDELGLIRLRESYMLESETSPQHRFAYVSKTFGSDLEHSQRLYDYSSKHWLSYSTPILSFGRTDKGQPIACFLPYLPDSSKGLVDTLSEVNWLSMFGGGIGLGIGIRSSDEKSTGVMPHLKTYDASSLAYRQGTTRRGSYATYLDLDHPNIIPFLEMRKPTGDPNMRCLNLHHGINIPDRFMEIIERCIADPAADDTWELIDPASKKVRGVLSARELWQKILEMRITTGEPYMHFIDQSNKHLPEFQQKLGLKIRQSNLCSEIVLPTDAERTAVCCLSSVNLEKYDEWKNNKLFLRDIAEMLDNVLSYFIKTAPDTISRARFSAMRERSIGVGALGFHSYLQENSIVFGSPESKKINKVMFKHISAQLNKANLFLGEARGEAPDAEGTGRRFSHTMAIAPNASTSIIMGNTSPSVEPFKANIYRQDTLSGSRTNRNKHLDKILHAHVQNSDSIDDISELYSSIMAKDGSVQHLEFLTDHEKEVFKTALEIDSLRIIELAADRQPYIDQAQSINVFLLPTVSIRQLHDVHFQAWKLKLKTLYYCRSKKINSVDKVAGQLERHVIEELPPEVEPVECPSCEG